MFHTSIYIQGMQKTKQKTIGKRGNKNEIRRCNMQCGIQSTILSCENYQDVLEEIQARVIHRPNSEQLDTMVNTP